MPVKCKTYRYSLLAYMFDERLDTRLSRATITCLQDNSKFAMTLATDVSFVTERLRKLLSNVCYRNNKFHISYNYFTTQHELSRVIIS